MLMSFKNLLTSLGLLVTFSGCSLMLPYHEDFSCNKGVGEGTCSSVTENYEYAIKMGRSSSGESHLHGTYANTLTNHDDAYDKVIVIDDAVKEGKR